MLRLRYYILIVGVCVALTLTGCQPRAIPASRPYVLVRQEGGDLAIVGDDAAIYDDLEAELLNAPDLQSLVALYDHTRSAYIATETIAPRSGMMQNGLTIVLSDGSTGVLQNARVWDGTGYVAIERVVSIGFQAGADPNHTRDALALVLPWMLLELVGYPTFSTEEEAPWPHQMTTRRQALAQGFALAVSIWCAEGEMRGAHSLEPALATWEDAYTEPLDVLIRENRFRYRFRHGAPTDELRPREESLCTPGVVAALLYRLLGNMEAGYPQRFMLWFVNYEGCEIPCAKLMLAVSRMGRRSGGVEAFVDSYAETFPVERALILPLVEEIFGNAEALGSSSAPVAGSPGCG